MATLAAHSGGAGGRDSGGGPGVDCEGAGLRQHHEPGHEGRPVWVVHEEHLAGEPPHQAVVEDAGGLEVRATGHGRRTLSQLVILGRVLYYYYGSSSMTSRSVIRSFGLARPSPGSAPTREDTARWRSHSAPPLDMPSLRWYRPSGRPFPPGFVPGSAIGPGVTRPRVMTARGCDQFPASCPVSERFQALPGSRKRSWMSSGIRRGTRG
jgi:hypothetical protein